MRIETVRAVWFSPTGTVREAALVLGERLGAALDAPCQGTDLTLRRRRADAALSLSASDLALAVMPVYAGRLPNKIAPDLRRCLHGDHTPAVPVVLYGNRSFDNALAELAALLSENGFRPVSAAAFVSRHAFTDRLGTGRPDAADRREMADFADRTAEKLAALPDADALPALRIPGDPAAPYYVPLGTDGKPAKFLRAKPGTDLSRCRKCGVCADRCPMGAIDPADTSSVPGTCIKCQSCVRRCPAGAKVFDDPAFLSHVAMLERNFSGIRRENAVFL